MNLGACVEGRDERSIKKTVCGIIKILHPDGKFAAADFESYLAYALEARRRVKEQMNKRKPDDEFARIDLSFTNSDGKEVVVYCPESKGAAATQQPSRRSLDSEDEQKEETSSLFEKAEDNQEEQQAPQVAVEPSIDVTPQEKHFTVHYGATGFSYESILKDYLGGASEARVEDPFVRLPHQIHNFVRFCEAIMKHSAIKKISLVTASDSPEQKKEAEERLGELQQSLLELDVDLKIEYSEKLHDREISFDNGWIVKIGRGLDFYQKPESWFEVGSHDLHLRKCLETKVDIFQKPGK
jgi:ATP-dependent Lon protease